MKTNCSNCSIPLLFLRRINPFLLCLLSAMTAAAAPFGTEFAYQGRLDGAAGPANGRYDFTFALHLAASGGTAVVNVTNSNVAVSNGLFTTAVDFGGGIYNGNAYWIQLGARTNGSGSFTVLSPRQPLTPTPNAHYAALAGTVPGGSINSTKLAADSVTSAALQNNAVTGAKIANGQVVRSLNGLRDTVTLAAGEHTTLTTNGNTLTLAGSGDWKLGGNAGTTPAANFIGTSDNQPLTVKVNGSTALRIDPTASAPNIIGGLSSFLPTVVGANVRGAVVAGGNAPAGPVTGLGGGDFHAVYDSDGTIGGGFGNKIGTDNGDADDAPFGTVAGGVFNSAASYAATVAGGDGNFASGTRATIGGGAGNQATGTDSAVGGGAGNRAESHHSSIGGGQNNVANNAHSSVAGGGWNTASGISSFIGGGGGDTFGGPYPNTASGNWSAILGGWNNTASGYSAVVGGGGNHTASGMYAVVPGGDGNQATAADSFAAGRFASAEHAGSFVWSDGTAGTFSSAGPNTFNVRAGGGVRMSGAGLLSTGSGNGVQGNSANPGASGLYGENSGGGFGIAGRTTGSGSAVFGDNADASGWAGNFNGRVSVSGDHHVGGNVMMNAGLSIVSGGRLHIQANESLYLNPFAGAGTVIVGGGGGPGNLAVLGNLEANGIGLPNNFGPDGNFAAPGNHISFGHPGVSEDFIGYRDNTFFFKDSPGGGDVCDPTVEVAVLRITGGCDLAEPFQMSHEEIPKGAVVIDEDRPGHLKMSDGAYDTRVADIVSGANGVKAGITLHQEGLIEGGQNVALSGRVYVQADASERPIKPGDLLTTSATPGYAMKVTDHAKAQGAILGKAMTGLKEGMGMVLVLVTLQ
jgi:hypothetical protein